MSNMRIINNHSPSKLKFMVILTVFMMIFIYGSAVSSFAASAISIGGETSVNEGDTFNISVTFSGDNIGRVDGQMTYDSSVLSYVSGGTSTGDNGYIELKDAGTGEDLTFNIKFKAVGGGSSNISVSTNGIYNLEEEYVDAPSASKTVTVAAEEETTEETETTETTETTQVTESSSDVIEVDPDTILPENESDDPSLLKILPFIVMALLVVAIIIVAIAIKRSRRRRR